MGLRLAPSNDKSEGGNRHEQLENAYEEARRRAEDKTYGGFTWDPKTGVQPKDGPSTTPTR